MYLLKILGGLDGNCGSCGSVGLVIFCTYCQFIIDIIFSNFPTFLILGTRMEYLIYQLWDLILTNNKFSITFSIIS